MSELENAKHELSQASIVLQHSTKILNLAVKINQIAVGNINKAMDGVRMSGNLVNLNKQNNSETLGEAVKLSQFLIENCNECQVILNETMIILKTADTDSKEAYQKFMDAKQRYSCAVNDGT
jgi:hypothetical protein